MKCKISWWIKEDQDNKEEIQTPGLTADGKALILKIVFCNNVDVFYNVQAFEENWKLENGELTKEWLLMFKLSGLFC